MGSKPVVKKGRGRRKGGGKGEVAYLEENEKITIALNSISCPPWKIFFPPLKKFPTESYLAPLFSPLSGYMPVGIVEVGFQGYFHEKGNFGLFYVHRTFIKCLK